MRYGIELVTLGPLAEPAVIVDLAVEAEAAGFEMVAVWDHHAFVWGVPSADAIVSLAAVAQATQRIRLLPFVLALPRYRPHVLAVQLAALDRLSGGRLMVGAGLGGVPDEFAAFGDSADTRTRAARLDEALDILARLWSGNPLTHAGDAYEVNGVTLAPLPVQRPRPPILVGGESGAALRRAARWDGWGMTAVDQSGAMTRSADEIAAHVDKLRDSGARIGRGFDVVVSGVSGGSRTMPDEYAAAGATWWLEAMSPSFGDIEELRARIRRGPPR